MGFVSGLLGTAGGINGTGVQGPSSANLLNPTTADQVTTAYDQSQNAIQQQQAFLNALAAQNGIGNQTDVYNQMQGVANGTGPNPAQAQLANSTGANVANQAALMAGQRGSSANAGLLARQAAMQGANIQQNAAGQGAALQAQQSLGAMQNLGNLASQQVAQQQAGQQQLNASVQGQQQNLLNAVAGQNNAAVGNQSSINNANAGIAGGVMEGQKQLLGGVMQGAGSAFGMANGGEVPAGPKSGFGKFMKGFGDGMNQPAGHNANPFAPGFAAAGKAINGAFQPASGSTGLEIANPLGMSPQAPAPQFGGLGVAPAPAASPFNLGMQYADGGKVQALVSPGEVYLDPRDVKQVAKGKADPIKAGERIPGKPKVGGAVNSYANDTVPKTLESGGIVLPRSVTQAKDPAEEARKFVSALLAKKAK